MQDLNSVYLSILLFVEVEQSVSQGFIPEQFPVFLISLAQEIRL